MPILMVETGGHHARVRSLLWQDDFTLLSGGEDKVVKVWDFHEDPRLARSIRPMIWRGPAGIIYAMAVSPRPDAQGQSFLAVAGYGIEARRGDITVFRIPGLVRTPTGEVAARMLPPPDDQPQAIGHRNAVSCMAFDPTGRVLASGSADTTIILWDVPGFRPRAVLGGRPGSDIRSPVRTLAFSPDGSRLASGGADGSLRIWDVARGTQVDSCGQRNPTRSIPWLTAPTASRSSSASRHPDGSTCTRPRNLAAPPAQLPTQDGQGPVECVAYPPRRAPPTAGRQHQERRSPRCRTPCGCRVTSRSATCPAGNVVHRRRVPGLVHALAFSPDGRRLAYAGGTAQAIQIVDPAAPNRPPREIRGRGEHAV